MIKPRAVRPGDRVAVVSPASPFARDELDRGVAELRRLGYEPVYEESIFDTALFTSGTAETRAADTVLRRPLVCSPDSQIARYAHVGNILLLDDPALAVAADPAGYTNWLRERANLAGRDHPWWACVATEPAENLLAQTAAVDPQTAAEMTLSLHSMRVAALAAVAAGARGICFTSRSRLDGPDPQSQARARVLRLLNQELSIVEPWGAAAAPEPRPC